MNFFIPLKDMTSQLKDRINSLLAFLRPLLPSNDSEISERFRNEEHVLKACYLLMRGYKRFIIAFSLFTTILVTCITLFMNDMFTATASILPPQQDKSAASQLFAKGGVELESLFGSILNRRSTTDLYAGILRSRTAKDKIISQFDLKKVYKEKYHSALYDLLDKRTKIIIDRKNQIMDISVTDESPQRASDITNAYIDILDEIYRGISVSEGHRKRVFFKNRIKQVSTDLEKAEAELKAFQEKTGLVSIEDQAKSFIEQVTLLKSEILLAEINLEVQEKFGTVKQNETLILTTRLNELRNQLDRLENNKPQSLSGVANPTSNEDVDTLSLKTLPALGLRFGGLLRNTKIQDKILKMTTLHYELAKMEEAKDIRVVQVLDEATPPDKKSSPNRKMIILLYAIASIVTAILISILIENFKKNKI